MRAIKIIFELKSTEIKSAKFLSHKNNKYVFVPTEMLTTSLFSIVGTHSAQLYLY